MDLIVGIAAGFLFGLAVAGVNTAVMARALRSRSAGALTVAVALRTVLDLLALGAVYLTRSVLPLPFEPTLIATAVGLSVGIFGLAILTMRQRSRTDSAEKEGE